MSTQRNGKLAQIFRHFRSEMVFLRGFGKDHAWSLVGDRGCRRTGSCTTLNWPKSQSVPHKYDILKEWPLNMRGFQRNFRCIIKRTIVFAEDEKERLLRLWLEPPSPSRRAHVKFEVMEQDVMSAPVDIALEHWYHFCQSWSNNAGQWALYINGKLAATGEDWQVTILHSKYLRNTCKRSRYWRGLAGNYTPFDISTVWM